MIPIARPNALSHVHLFAVGWVYYLVLPLLVGSVGLLDAIASAEPVARLFGVGTSAGGAALVGFVGMMPLAFLAGHGLSRFIARLPAADPRVALPSTVVLPLYVVLLLFFARDAADLLFQGYAQGVEPAVVGPIATLAMVALFQYLICRFAGLVALRRCFGLLCVLACVLLLSMGGRLYAVSAIVAVWFSWWKWSDATRSARRRSLVGLVAMALLLVFIGMWRVDSVAIADLAFFLLAEPLFTSISALTFLGSDTWRVFDTPRDFWSAFLNLVPTAVWPDKASQLVALADTELDFESPFGGLSIVVSAIGNFGFVGGLVFIAFVGFFLGFASRHVGTPVSRAYYVFVTCMLPFIFFRDPFHIQIKLVLTATILLVLHHLFDLRIRPRQVQPGLPRRAPQRPFVPARMSSEG